MVPPGEYRSDFSIRSLQDLTCVIIFRSYVLQILPFFSFFIQNLTSSLDLHPPSTYIRRLFTSAVYLHPSSHPLSISSSLYLHPSSISSCRLPHPRSFTSSFLYILALLHPRFSHRQQFGDPRALTEKLSSLSTVKLFTTFKSLQYSFHSDLLNCDLILRSKQLLHSS